MTDLIHMVSFNKEEANMLVRITQKCRMQCPHCMVEATPDGEHMTMDTFRKVVGFIKANTVPLIMVSGGEPMENPQALEFLAMAKEELHVVMLSNGMFLSDAGLRDAVIGLGISVQITSDPRFYGTKIQKFDHPSFMYEDHIRSVTPIGRAATNKIECNRQSPLCFNLRSATRTTGDIWTAIRILRQGGKMCTPSINVNGDVVAGESSLCHKIGTIDSTTKELTDGACGMRCNQCGLEDKLSVVHKHVIGLYD